MQNESPVLHYKGHQISWIRRKILKIGRIFEIFDTFSWVNQQCSIFNSILRIEKRYLAVSRISVILGYFWSGHPND